VVAGFGVQVIDIIFVVSTLDSIALSAFKASSSFLRASTSLSSFVFVSWLSVLASSLGSSSFGSSLGASSVFTTLSSLVSSFFSDFKETILPSALASLSANSS
jgi:hypothetical protein